MLNRRRRHQTPTFLEGTPGLYVKRESPPCVPSTAPIPTKTDVVSGCSSNHKNVSRSLSSSHSSLIQPTTSVVLRKKTTPLGACGASTPALVASTLYASASSVATTVGGENSVGTMISSAAPETSEFAQQLNNFSSMQSFSRLQQQIHNGLKHDFAGRRLSHTPIRPQRRAAPRNELSSHSFNNPPSSSWAKSYGNGLSAMALNTCKESVDLISCGFQRTNLSNDAADNQKNYDFKRKNLAASLSFGNVIESIDDNDFISNVNVEMSNGKNNHSTNLPCTLPNVRPGIVRKKTSISSNSTNKKGSSMQSLLSSSILQDSMSNSSANVSILPVGNALTNIETDLPLPSNWEMETTPEGIRYYVDHNHKRTHWIHPLAVENLSLGWIKIFDQTHGVVYYNEIEQRLQFEHPGLATPAAVKFNSNDQTQFVSQFHRHVLNECSTNEPSANFVEDFNIIDDGDVSEWIRLYSEAPFESDHLLNWNLFDLSQLEDFDQMLMKLFKQDAINTVIKYERPRREINDELARRNNLIA